MTLGTIVKNLRNSMGLSQVQLGKICGVSDVFISYIERGRRTAEIQYGSDFYWRLASLAFPESENGKKCLYAELILADLRYRYPESMDLCLSHLQKATIGG